MHTAGFSQEGTCEQRAPEAAGDRPAGRSHAGRKRLREGAGEEVFLVLFTHHSLISFIVCCFKFLCMCVCVHFFVGVFGLSFLKGFRSVE